MLGNYARALRIAFDYLDLVGLLEGKRQAHADISAAGDDDPAHRVLQLAHFTHENPDILACGDEEDLVIFFNDGIAVELQRLSVTVDGGNTGLGIGYVFFQRRNLLANQQAVTIGTCADQSYPPAGKFQYLHRARIQNELFDILADQLLRADAHIDRDCILFEQLPGAHVFSRPDARDLGRCVIQGIRDLTGNHVGLIHIGQRDDDIGVICACALENVRIGGVTDNRSNIEPILQFAQNVGPHIDNGDFVRFFARQMVGGRGANLTSAENQYFHYLCTRHIQATPVRRHCVSLFYMRSRFA